VPVIAPLIRLAPPADPAPLARAAANAERYDWLVFTSANAVRVLLAAAAAEGVSARDLAGARIAAVGPSTAAALEAVGLSVLAVPAIHAGAAVAGAMIEAGLVPRQRVLWARAAGASDVLLERLAGAGARVDAVDAYRTIEDTRTGAELAEAVRSGRIDALTFTSPSAVRAYAEGSAEADAPVGPGPVVVAVIGRVTAAAARRAGLEVDVEPAEHSLEAMVAALARVRRGESSA